MVKGYPARKSCTNTNRADFKIRLVDRIGQNHNFKNKQKHIYIYVYIYIYPQAPSFAQDFFKRVLEDLRLKTIDGGPQAQNHRFALIFDSKTYSF